MGNVEGARQLHGQPFPAWTDGHGTDPYEQKTQQSPVFGFSRVLHPLQ